VDGSAGGKITDNSLSRKYPEIQLILMMAAGRARKAGKTGIYQKNMPAVNKLQQQDSS
jgi:hypothetical protein